MTSSTNYPRRITIVSQYFWPEPGAPSVRYAAITRVLRALGIEVNVITGAPNYPSGRVSPGYRAWWPSTERHDGVQIARLPLFPYGGRRASLRLLNQASFAASALAGVALKTQPDLVVVESPPLPLVLAGASIARRHDAPLVMYAADLWPGVALAMGALHPGFVADRLADLESLCYHLAWRITVPTAGLYDMLRAHASAGPDKVLLLPNGVDLETFRPYSAADCEAERRAIVPLDARLLFTYGGTVGASQALDVIVGAAALLRDNDRIGFLVIGEGPERERLLGRAERLALENIRFLPAVEPTRFARFLALSRATIAPLRDTPLFSATRPAKVLPSLACERPVIFCGRGEMAELLTTNRCGVVVPPEDAGSLARAVTRLADDDAEAAAMGQRGRALAVREYDFDALVRGWLGTLSEARPSPGRNS